MKNRSDQIGIQALDLRACIAVPHRTAPLPTPKSYYSLYRKDRRMQYMVPNVTSNSVGCTQYFLSLGVHGLPLPSRRENVL